MSDQDEPTRWYQQALAAQEERRWQAAADGYGRVLTVAPGFAPAWHHLGQVRHQLGDPAGALAALQRAAALQSPSPELLRDLGALLLELGRPGEAEAALRAALTIRADFAPGHFQLGRALAAQGRWEAAAEAYAAAVTLRPGHLKAWNALGLARYDLGDAAAAEAVFRRALALHPQVPEFHNNRGLALYDLARFEDAENAFRAALARRPDYAQARYLLGLLELLLGRYREGWEHYEARWRLPSMQSLLGASPAPLWDGSPLAGRRLLVHPEQGLGDTLQFARFLPGLAGEGRILLVCPPALRRLLDQLPGVELLSPDAPLPEHELQVPLMGLPGRLGIHEPGALNGEAYLAPPVPPAPRRRDRRRVGLVWAGNPLHSRDRFRSVALARLAPLLERSGVDFVSLQKGPAQAQLREADLAGRVEDVGAALEDFADTAVALAGLDLLISVDTSVAHLAGALGVPLWLLLPTLPDWRWGLAGEATPWYASARLFRQRREGDWDELLERLGRELDAWSGESP